MHRASEIPELKAWSNPPPLHLASFKKALRQAWRRIFGDICPACNVRMHFEIRFRASHHYATIDHILARGLGGTDSLDNIQVVCKSCNNIKSIEEYHKKYN